MLNIYYGNETINRERFIFNRIRTGEKPEGFSGMTIMIVPDQFSLQTEQNALKSLGRKGLMDFMVADFTSLGHKTLKEAGIKEPELIDKYGRHMLLSLIIDRLSDELDVYRGYASKGSFVELTNTLISEMKRYGVLPEEIAQKAEESAIDNTYLKYKLSDIKKIFSVYEESIADKYLDSEDYIRYYGKIMMESELIKGSDIWIYGFDTFSPLNLEIITRLIKTASTVNIVMTCEYQDNEKPRDGRLLTIGGGDNLFSLSQFIINQLKETGESIGSSVRIEAIPDEKEIHKKSIWDFEKLPVTLARTTNVYTEADRLASWIVSLVRDEGYRYGDITVICNDMDTRGGIIERALERNGIPVFTDRKRGVMHQPAVNFLLALCDIVSGRGDGKSLLMLVKSGLLGWSRDDESLLENYINEFNIRFSSIKKPFHRNANKYTDDEMARLNEMRQVLDEIVSSAKDDIGRRNSAGNKVHGLYDFLESRFDIRNKIEELVNCQEEMGLKDAAAETAQSWNMICALFSQILRIMGDENISNVKLRDVLKSGFEEMEIGIVPSSEDVVIVGTMQRTRVSRTKVLAVTGANEGIIPMIHSENGILTEKELDILENLKLNISKRENVSRQEEQMAIYRMMSLPEDKLYVSCSFADQDGKGIVPSSIFGELIDISGCDECLGDVKPESLESITNAKGTAAPLAYVMRKYADGDEEFDKNWLSAINWFVKNDSETLNKIIAGITFTGEVEHLEKDIADALFRNDRDRLYVSATRLEQYSRCPFSYFVNYGLGAQESRSFEIDARDIGDAYHRCLMKFSRSLTPSDGSLLDKGKDAWMNMDEESCRAKVREILIGESESYREGVFSGNNIGKFRMECIEEICGDVAWVLVNQVKHGIIKSMKFEQPFGMNGDLEVELDNGIKACVNGQIDRIDYIGDEAAPRVIDYKTGDNTINIEHIRAGYKLQLMLYMNAAINSNKDVRPAGVFYMKIKNYDDDVTNGRTPDEKSSDYMADYMKHFRMDGILNDDAKLIEMMDTNLSGVSSRNDSAESDIIPVKFVKKDSCYKNRSGGVILAEKEFKELCDITTENVRRICNNICNGNIDVRPKREKDATRDGARKSACTFCKLRSICMFDTGLGCEYDDI